MEQTGLQYEHSKSGVIMQEICDQWTKEMRAVRRERRLMILSIVLLAGVRIFGL